jgi:hypothetical protein
VIFSAGDIALSAAGDRLADRTAAGGLIVTRGEGIGEAAGIRATEGVGLRKGRGVGVLSAGVAVAAAVDFRVGMGVRSGDLMSSSRVG